MAEIAPAGLEQVSSDEKQVAHAQNNGVDNEKDGGEAGQVVVSQKKQSMSDLFTIVSPQELLAIFCSQLIRSRSAPVLLLSRTATKTTS